jgi:hypothetical protein
VKKVEALEVKKKVKSLGAVKKAPARRAGRGF